MPLFLLVFCPASSSPFTLPLPYLLYWRPFPLPIPSSAGSDVSVDIVVFISADFFFFFFYRASSQFRKFTDLVTRIPLTCFTHVILFQSYISILSLISLYMHARRDIDTTCTHWPFDANTWMYRTRVCILVCTQTYIQFHLLLIIFLFRFPFLILFTTLLSSSS